MFFNIGYVWKIPWVGGGGGGGGRGLRGGGGAIGTSRSIKYILSVWKTSKNIL